MKESYEGRRMTYVLVYTHFTLFCGNLSHVSHLTCLSPCLSSHHLFLISPSLSHLTISHHRSTSLNLSLSPTLLLSHPQHNTNTHPLNCLTALPPNCTEYAHSPRPPPPAAAAARTPVRTAPGLIICCVELLIGCLEMLIGCFSPVRTAPGRRPPPLSRDTLAPIPK